MERNGVYIHEYILCEIVADSRRCHLQTDTMLRPTDDKKMEASEVNADARRQFPSVISYMITITGRFDKCPTLLGHLFCGEYYARFVECDVPHQTRTHILIECPLLEPYYHLLRATSRSLSLPILLSTKTGRS
jgi:hypothetical protein